MPTNLGIAYDYSARAINPAALKAARAEGVIRYVGFPGRHKTITQAEYDDLRNARIPVALVYENSVGDALGGNPAGLAAAQIARDHATSLGFPRSRPIYYTVDQDTNTAQQKGPIVDYFRGVLDAEGSPRKVGVYGEYDVVSLIVTGRMADYAWQTRAWSRGMIWPGACIYQDTTQRFIDNVETDVNRILRLDWGQDRFTPPAPAPTPAKDDDMFPIMVYAHGHPMYLYWPSSSKMVGIGDPVERDILKKVHAEAGHPIEEIKLSEPELAQLIEFARRAGGMG